MTAQPLLPGLAPPPRRRRQTETWSTDDLTAAAERHLLSSWAVLREVTAGVDETMTWSERAAERTRRMLSGEGPAERRIDLLAFRRPQRRHDQLGPLERLALEVKVSRQDFLQDVRDPSKQAPWRKAAHRHAYVAPEGLIDKEEVPEGSGLLVASRASIGKPGMEKAYVQWKWVVRAPYTLTDPTLPVWFTRLTAFRAAYAEMRLRGRVDETADQDPVELAATIATLRRDLEKTRGRLDRERDASSRWRQLAAAGGIPIACAFCGQPITVVSVRTHQERWKHITREHDAPCEPLRVHAYTHRLYEGAPSSFVQSITPREDPEP